jgi:arabinose-5-phosphate isomerase
MGKSGHIGRKIAATMTSTGTPAFFLHPAEAVHGDLGMVQKGDAALVLSKSGDTPETTALLPSFRRLAVPVVAMVSRTDSDLGRAAEVVLRLPEMPEACPHNLSPTASTTAMLVLGDALAMALLKVHDFSPQDFADVHPGGTLGRKLLTRVSDLMAGPPLPVLEEGALLADAIPVLTANRGVCISVDGDGILDGIFVYGDLGRLLRSRPDALAMRMSDILKRSPAVASPDELAASALATMEEKGITSLVVVDPEGRPAGIIHLHDVMRAGIR